MSDVGAGRSRIATAWDLLWVRGVGRVLSLLLIAPIRVYQWTLSPLLAASCRYHPSCSRYAVGALAVHGPVKGLVLAAWRLLRCNPWTRGGLDPVPDRGHWRPAIHPDGRPRHPGSNLPPTGPDTTAATVTLAPDDVARDAAPDPRRATQTSTGPVADRSATIRAGLGTSSQGA